VRSFGGVDRRRFRRNERRWRKAEKVVELEVVGGDHGAADHDRGEQIVAEQRSSKAGKARRVHRAAQELVQRMREAVDQRDTEPIVLA